MREEYLRDISSFGGMPLYLVVMAIFLVLNSFAAFNQLLFGLILSYAVTVFFRIVYFKKRPKVQGYNNWFERIDASSFPSLHAMRSAVVGIVLANFFSNIILTVVFSAAIIGTVVTRVMLKRHDILDSVGGAAFGVAVGFLVMGYSPDFYGIARNLIPL